MSKYFGTDGIRSKANTFPLDVDTVIKIGIAAGVVIKKDNHKHRVVIGKDTRLSGYMIESALCAGFNSVGIDVFLVGPIATPGISMLTRSMRCDLGVMVSASHNPFYDNGIKFFDSKGLKFPDKIEAEIEKVLEEGDLSKYLVTDDKIGRAKRSDNNIYQQRYTEFVKYMFPRDKNLNNFKIVLDCANGSNYKIAPMVLWELGADLTVIGNNPTGLNINAKCGSTDTRLLQKTVLKEKADLGIALDGDADRLIMVDEKGNEIDGDEIIALIAKDMKERGTLKHDTVVVTQMSNLGFENYMNGLGIKVIRSKVGDRYVTEEMWKGGYNLGGEQSGHIVLGDFSTTGDGLGASLMVLGIYSKYKEKNKDLKFSDLMNVFKKVPQVLENIEFEKDQENPLEKEEVKSYLSKIEADIKGEGRILIRKSGTQPLIRVMVEHSNKDKMNELVKDIVEKIKKNIK